MVEDNHEEEIEKPKRHSHLGLWRGNNAEKWNIGVGVSCSTSKGLCDFT